MRRRTSTGSTCFAYRSSPWYSSSTFDPGPGDQVVHPVHRSKERGLAAPGRSDQGGDPLWRDVDRHVLDRPEGRVEERQPLERQDRRLAVRRRSRRPTRGRSAMIGRIGRGRRRATRRCRWRPGPWRWASDRPRVRTSPVALVSIAKDHGDRVPEEGHHQQGDDRGRREVAELLLGQLRPLEDGQGQGRERPGQAIDERRVVGRRERRR